MRKFLIAFLLIAAVLFISREYSSSLGKPTKIDIQLNEEKLFELTNKWRLENSLNSYVKSELLCGFANKRLEEIKLDFSHNGFNSKSQDFLVATKYDSIGENIAKDYVSEEKTLEGWLNSPSHLKALEADYTDSCIKCGDRYCVHIFAR